METLLGNADLTTLLVAIIGMVMAAFKTIEIVGKRKNGNGHTVLGKTVAIFDHSDRERLNAMHAVILAQGWDAKLNTILDILRDIKRLESEGVQIGKEELKALKDHFKDFDCLARKVDVKK